MLHHILIAILIGHFTFTSIFHGMFSEIIGESKDSWKVILASLVWPLVISCILLVLLITTLNKLGRLLGPIVGGTLDNIVDWLDK